MRGVELHIVGQRENQRRIADILLNFVDAGVARLGHNHRHACVFVDGYQRPHLVARVHRAPFRIGERHLPRAA